MKADRRTFLWGAPAGLLGLGELAELTWAQAGGATTPMAKDVADFWVKRMGVPPSLLLVGAPRGSSSRRPVEQLSTQPNLTQPRGGATELSSRTPIEISAASAGVVDFNREAMFFHLDDDEHALIPAHQVPQQKLHPSGDTVVELQLHRLRLSPDDTGHFARYASGGIYADMEQQQQQQQRSNNPLVTALGSSTLGAFFPASNSASAPSSKQSKTKSSAGAGATADPSIVPLQQSVQAQTIGLPNGVGRVSFACFMKDRRKSLFGNCISAVLQMGGSPTKLSYLPMLSLPVVAAPALMLLRTVVANLQGEGLDHKWILGGGPVDVSATAAGCSNLPNGLRLRTGTYIAVPREHSDLLRDKLGGLSIQDGFLVPKDTPYLDVYHAVPETLRGVTYLSIALTVKPAKITGCMFPAAGA